MRLEDVHRQMDKLVGIALQAAADEHRANRQPETEVAMQVAQALHGQAVALATFLVRQGAAPAPAPRSTLRQRLVGALAYLVEGR